MSVKEGLWACQLQRSGIFLAAWTGATITADLESACRCFWSWKSREASEVLISFWECGKVRVQAGLLHR